MDNRQSCTQPTATPLHPTMSWWATLAYAETPPAALGATPAAIHTCAQALAAQNQSAAATLIAQVAREVTRDETAVGDRCVWGFRRLSDALVAARATHRSDYHAYPLPQTLREAALDRLYRRFPLNDFPRVTVLLFTGLRLCDDPRLCADPHAESLLAQAEGVIAPEEWERYTVCGFRQGVSLVRALGASRWLRVSLDALEDAWALGQAEAQGRPLAASADPRASEEARLRAAETRARDLLLRAASPEALLRLDDDHGGVTPQPLTDLAALAERALPSPAARDSSRRRPVPGGKPLPYRARRPAV